MKTLIYTGDSYNGMVEYLNKNSSCEVIMVNFKLYTEMIEKSSLRSNNWPVSTANEKYFFMGRLLFPFLQNDGRCYKCGKGKEQYYLCQNHIVQLQMLSKMEE